MHSTLIDLGVLLFLFVLGVSSTVYRFAKHDRLAFTVLAILSPAIVVISMFRLVYLLMTNNAPLRPVPVGLEEAEIAVEAERKRMFGGELRRPTLARDWQRAYEMELQREAEHIQRFAQRVSA
ncbi:MAG TPA: hypothetical protein VFC39_21135 [Acidobacteriaceae bacterium]|nr:hypothetical protein [Acidobacteriaceae bacterium]